MAFWMYRIIGHWFRERRLAWAHQKFASCRTVIDLGGTRDYWEHAHSDKSITLLNVTEPKSPFCGNFQMLQGDGCHTNFPDQAFDLAFSNSAIEHVGGAERQRQFAGELLRLAPHVYCQTPNKWFPIEPHYLGLFLHWLPERWRGGALHRWTTLNGLRKRPYEPVRLLSRNQFAALFPGCTIETERFFGLAKSFIAWK